MSHIDLLALYLEQILKLVDAEAQLGHAGLEQLPQPVLLHQPHKHTERLLLRHLGGGDRGVSEAPSLSPNYTHLMLNGEIQWD